VLILSWLGAGSRSHAIGGLELVNQKVVDAYIELVKDLDDESSELLIEGLGDFMTNYKGEEDAKH
jgi:hypothetical protein